MSLITVLFSSWCVCLTLNVCELWCWCKCSACLRGVKLCAVFWYNFTYMSGMFRCFVNNTCKSCPFVAVCILVVEKVVHSMDRAGPLLGRAGTGSKWGWGQEPWASTFLPVPSERRCCQVTHPGPNHSFQSLLLCFLGSSMATLSGQLGRVVTAGGSGPRSCAPTTAWPRGREDFSVKSLGKTQLKHWLPLPPPLQCLLIFATPSSLFWATARNLSSWAEILNTQYSVFSTAWCCFDV